MRPRSPSPRRAEGPGPAPPPGWLRRPSAVPPLPAGPQVPRRRLPDLLLRCGCCRGRCCGGSEAVFSSAVNQAEPGPLPHPAHRRAGIRGFQGGARRRPTRAARVDAGDPVCQERTTRGSWGAAPPPAVERDPAQDPTDITRRTAGITPRGGMGGSLPASEWLRFLQALASFFAL